MSQTLSFHICFTLYAYAVFHTVLLCKFGPTKKCCFLNMRTEGAVSSTVFNKFQILTTNILILEPLMLVLCLIT